MGTHEALRTRPDVSFVQVCEGVPSLPVWGLRTTANARIKWNLPLRFGLRVNWNRKGNHHVH